MESSRTYIHVCLLILLFTTFSHARHLTDRKSDAATRTSKSLSTGGVSFLRKPKGESAVRTGLVEDTKHSNSLPTDASFATSVKVNQGFQHQSGVGQDSEESSNAHSHLVADRKEHHTEETKSLPPNDIDQIDDQSSHDMRRIITHDNNTENKDSVNDIPHGPELVTANELNRKSEHAVKSDVRGGNADVSGGLNEKDNLISAEETTDSDNQDTSDRKAAGREIHENMRHSITRTEMSVNPPDTLHPEHTQIENGSNFQEATKTREPLYEDFDKHTENRNQSNNVDVSSEKDNAEVGNHTLNNVHDSRIEQPAAVLEKARDTEIPRNAVAETNAEVLRDVDTNAQEAVDNQPPSDENPTTNTPTMASLEQTTTKLEIRTTEMDNSEGNRILSTVITPTEREPEDVEPLSIFTNDIKYQRFPRPMSYTTFKKEVLGKPLKKLYILEESEKKLFQHVRQLEAVYTVEDGELYVSFLFRFVFSRKCQEIQKFKMGKRVGNTDLAMFEKEKNDGNTERILFFSERPEDYVFFMSCTDMKNSPYACRDTYYVTLDSVHDPPNQFPWGDAARELKAKMNLTFEDPRFIFNFVLLPCARTRASS